MKKRMTRTNHILASVIATALGTTLASSAYSQSADATLRGKATPGAEVTAKNVATGAVRHTATGSDGTYVLVGLPPGIYKVDAGAGTERVVTVNVATTAVLDFVGGAAVAPDTTLADITVKSSKLVEVRTSEVGKVVSMDQIATVPQLTRNFLEFADVVPGIVFNVDSHGKTSIRGGAQNDNTVNVYIDGVGQKGYVRSGLTGQTDNTQGNPFPQMAIGEYKVITSNYKAEYDQISSAAVVADTKSGTNEFHGEAFVTYTNQSMRAETPAELGAGMKTDSKTKEFGVSVGGPIIQDQMHFFAAYEGKRYTTPSTVTFGSGTPLSLTKSDGTTVDMASLLPASVASQLGPVTIPFKEDLFFGKLDWEPGSDDRLVLDAKIRIEDSLGNQAGAGTAASASLKTHNTDNRYSLRWDHSGQNWFNEALFTFEDSFFVPQAPSGGGNGATYTYGANHTTILTADGVDPRAGQNKGQRGWSIGDTMTWSHLNFITGDHTVKAGVKFKAVKLTAMDAVLNSPPMFFYDVSADGGTSAIPYKATFAASAPNLDGIAVSKDRQLGVFLQDDWAVNDKLTLNLGVRWDIEWNPSYLDFKTPQALLDSFNTVVDPATGNTYGQTLGLSNDPLVHININDYLSNGHNREAYKGAIQPRLGFSYDLFEDQRHVLFGGVGRAFDRNLYDYLQLEITKIALSEPSVNFYNVPGTTCGTNTVGCYTWNDAYKSASALQALVSGSTGEPNLMNNHLKPPHSDQFTLGIRNKVGDWNTSASVSRIVSKDGIEFILGNRDLQGEFFHHYDWGVGQPWAYPAPNTNGNLILAKNGIETKNTQLALSAEKPYSEESGWGATLAYTYTNATQNRDINEHYVFDAPDAQAFKFITSNAAAKHRVVATATVKGPWDTMIGAKLTLATPIPFNGINCQANIWPNWQSTCYQRAVVASGLGIRTVDLQGTKNFRLGDKATLYVRLDALNVFNAKNLVDYNLASDSNGVWTGASYNQTGNITGTPRQFRLTLGAKF
jgi:outer membrane receptor protein involved in Fe transport